jgi:hypothetical protein
MLLPPVLVISYVNACSGDWWAGGSFSNRRFDQALPFLAIGLGHVLAGLVDLTRRRPGFALASLLGLAVLWNVLMMAQYRTNRLPLDETVSFARVAENAASLVQQTTGTPLAWPANWVFAAQHELDPGRYDLMAGKYLFYRQNNLSGVVDLGDPRADPALVGPGWGAPRNCENVQCRAVLTRGRLFAGLDVPETLDLAVRARGRGTLRLAVNGTGVGAFVLDERLAEHRLRVPAERWRRELNELSFDRDETGSVDVDRVVFARLK